jgi:ubiquinone/menaquinone biosynthesis C-methylase UbiE
MQTLSDSADTTRNPNAKSKQSLVEKGDFTEIAAMMRQSGEDLVRSLPIATPMRALDIGCGDGTTAVPLAILGADVLGIDIAEDLVRAGNERAARAGLTWLTFQEGDACNLRGIADEAFDLVISVFGATFAPKPFDVASGSRGPALPRNLGRLTGSSLITVRRKMRCHGTSGQTRIGEMR